MKKVTFSLALILILLIQAKGQSLYIPGGTNGIHDTPNGNLEVIGGDTRFDSNYKLYVPSMGSSYFWSGIDGVDNVRFSVWSKLTLYNPTVAGLNTNNSGWNIQLGARDGTIFTRGGAYFALSEGNVGVASSYPSDKLQLGDFNNSNNYKINIPGVYNFEQVRLGQFGNGSNGLELINHVSLSNSYGVRFYTNVDEGVSGLQIQTAAPTDSYNKLAYTTRMVIDWAGRVGIGTKTPGNYLLNVAGPIRADEIVVNTTGADFVFDPSYELRSLSELETFIRTNKHLPDIAPAKEMQENGVSAGEMQAKLLQKVEELTLYVIEKDKEIAEHNKLIADQNRKLEDQQKMLFELKKQIEDLKNK